MFLSLPSWNEIHLSRYLFLIVSMSFCCIVICRYNDMYFLNYHLYLKLPLTNKNHCDHCIKSNNHILNLNHSCSPYFFAWGQERGILHFYHFMTTLLIPLFHQDINTKFLFLLSTPFYIHPFWNVNEGFYILLNYI